MQEDQMKRFNDLGYTFETKYTPCNIGSTYHAIFKDKDGNEVIHAQMSYGNGSGHGYAVYYANADAVAQLEAIINGEVQPEEEYDTDFLNRLACEDYITDYGYLKDGELVILFDSWSQVEGKSHWDSSKDEEGNLNCKKVIDEPSVYEKLRRLAEKDLLKPSINKTINEVEYVFTDEYRRCDGCGKIMNTTWDGLRWIEETGEELCDDCINESEEAIECLIEEAKNDFSQALPVMIDEGILERLGYEKLDVDIDFSTRAEQWGEHDYGCHNIHSDVLKRICSDYNGFPKLTWVGQFDCNYNIYLPSDTVEEARKELGIEV